MENLNASSFVLIGAGITAIHFTRKKFNSSGVKEQLPSTAETKANPADLSDDSTVEEENEDAQIINMDEYCANNIYSFQSCHENKLNVDIDEIDEIESKAPPIFIPDIKKGIKINLTSQSFHGKCSVLDHIQNIAVKRDVRIQDNLLLEKPVISEVEEPVISEVEEPKTSEVEESKIFGIKELKFFGVEEHKITLVDEIKIFKTDEPMITKADEPIIFKPDELSNNVEYLPMFLYAFLVALLAFLFCVIIFLRTKVDSKNRCLENTEKVVINRESEPTPNVTSDSSESNSDEVQTSEDECDSIEPNETLCSCSEVSETEHPAEVEATLDQIIHEIEIAETNEEKATNADNETDSDATINSSDTELAEPERKNEKPDILRTECYYNAAKTVCGTVSNLPLVNTASSVLENVVEGVLSKTPMAAKKGGEDHEGKVVHMIDRKIQETLRNIDGGKKTSRPANTVHFPKREEKKKGKNIINHAMSGVDGIFGFVGGSLTNIITREKSVKVHENNVVRK